MRETAGLVGERRRNLLLVGLAMTGFISSTISLSLTPFLLTISNDLSIDLAAVSMVFSFTNLAWATTSLAVGPISDRLGRKPLIMLGLGLQILGCLGTALAQDFQSLSLWRFVVGVGGGSQTPNLYAIAADVFPASRRGMALGWIITGQSLSLVLGAPSSALIGSFSSWRWSQGVIGMVALVLLVLLGLLLPAGGKPVPAGGGQEGGLGRLLRRPRVLALLAIGSLERICYSSVVVFFATYLIATYDVPLPWVAAALIVAALGNLGGNQIGGRLADRIRRKQLIVAVALGTCGLLGWPLLTQAPGPVASVGLALLYNLASASVRPALLVIVSQLSREARGAVMGLNVTTSGIGWLVASAAGGWLVANFGFGALAALAAGSGLTGAALAILAGPQVEQPEPPQAREREQERPATEVAGSRRA